MTGTTLAYWEQKWAKSGSADASLSIFGGFERIFEAYLPRSQEGHPLDFLEIGCFPGRFLYYFGKEFGYRVHGIDYLPQAADIPKRLGALGVEARVMVIDFFDFKPEQGFDVVSSFGFVEHFCHWQDILDRHLDLLSPGGTLLIEIPNFRYFQYWLCRLLNPTLLQWHYLESMDPQLWTKALKARGLEVVFSGYYQTFQVLSGLEGSGPVLFLRKTLMGLVKLVRRVINRLPVDYPNRFFSPYIFVIARRPAIETGE